MKILPTELKSALKSVKNSSPGPDNIPNIFIQQLPKAGINYLLDIYNCIWLNGVFPTKWQEAIVVPILKPGKNKLRIDSYRPIALTCCLCKLLEKVICKRLRWYLETNNLLGKNQNGFRQYRSTMDNLAMLDINICEAFLRKQHLIAICLDIEKAYDMLWRHRIIQQLIKWNISGSMIQFIYNFLKSRSIYVRVNGNLSKKVEILNGVPQGSVLSVILFLIAINDIAEVFSKPVKYTIFADDCTFFITGKSLSTSQQILQDNLDRLQKYALQTGFKFSKNKTTVTVFSKQRTTQNHQLQLHLGQHQLLITSTPKILGLIFDNKYTWTPFLKKLKEKCVKRLNILKVIASKNWGAEFQILINTYKALVLSKLDYGSIVYDSAKPRVLKLLAPIHNAGARIVTGAFRTSPVNAILCEAGLIPLETRRKQLSLSYAATRLSTPSNPIYEKLTNIAHFNEFKEKPKLPEPLNSRVKTYWQELNMDTPKIISRIQYQIPPWTIDPPSILDKILKAGKQINPNVLKSLYTELSNEYPYHTQIFTDASKSGQGTGCAVCTPEHEILFRLPETFTIFTSEALAVLQALKYIEETTHNKSIILTDSKSVLLALQNLETNNTVIQNIIELNETLKRDKREVLYSWIPSHIGIEGNEKADTAAKLASSSTAITKCEQATHQDIQKHCTKAQTEVWNEEWRNSRPTKLHKVRNNIHDFNPALLLNRKDQAINLQESTENTVLQVENIKQQEEKLVPFDTLIDGKEISITPTLAFTKADGKDCNAVTATSSAQRCFVISRGHEINVEKFKKYAIQIARKFVELYPWYCMPILIDKILIHGPAIIASTLLHIGQLSEDAQETLNKYIKRFREDFSRKMSRMKTVEDVFFRLLIASDPYISSLRKLPQIHLQIKQNY
ncbi:uncharacterized protein LOC122403220 [Colletes gigas]|uniref:uncharacterized protein LOC122403220 n=1 Tax=Colletes gigas TaxID=935657 RepID=UPI001C9B5153|nr:uncharacterized protein LOC122403220 [Colletes gigas]